ncbi:ankyrin repeat-containing domain protein [Lasiosphaeria hispida]|uniref:Ankyrin repeat-containing domain protein n=1 Tax=Lasiosphaeria hispida TaxID=260671 RepID=A0AAJ0HVU2_9PEZI|nr:ankyrin repeat-containing domain protein [Lasiosphaeria hispida]
MWHDVARTLLEYGADPRQSRPSCRGSLPMLHLVIACPVMDKAEKQMVDTVRVLLQHGADVNGLDHEGWTPLHVAASWNNAAVIRELELFANGELAWDALTADNQTAEDLALGAGFDAEVQDLLQRRGDADSGDEQFFDCAE